MIGQKIFDFEITRKIKAGGMGAVYEAKRVWGRQERVAVKFLLEQYRDDDTIRRRFIREAEIMEMLNHPRIAKVLNLDPDHNAFVMEFIEGKTLADCIRNDPEKYRQPEVAVTMFAQLLDAFDYAHHVVIQRGSKQEQGVIHRDIKPSNIIIEPDGNPKILDFGISRVATFDSTLTDPKLQMGSVAYMSPEQVMNPGDVDWRSDIYALGVNLWELFAGHSPYPNVTSLHVAVDIQNRICNEPLPRLTNIQPGSDADQLSFLKRIDTIIDKATAKETVQRYQRCKDMRDALLATLLPVLRNEAPIHHNTVESSVSRSEGQKPKPEFGKASQSSVESITRVHERTAKPAATVQISVEAQQPLASNTSSNPIIAKESIEPTPRKSKSPLGNVIVLLVLILGGGSFALWYRFSGTMQERQSPVKEVTNTIPLPSETASVVEGQGDIVSAELPIKPKEYEFLTVVKSNLKLEVVEDASGRQGLRAEGGRMIYEPQFDKINLNRFDSGLIPVLVGKEEKYISHHGKDKIYDAIGSKGCGLIPVKVANRWGYVNLDGHEMIKIKEYNYTKAGAFNKDCTAEVTEPGGKSYRINRKGELQKPTSATKSAKTTNQAS